jgi:uncharacterized membrane protein
MMDLAANVMRKAGGRWIGLALVGSLVVNVVLIGASAGSFLRNRIAPTAVAAPTVAPNLLGFTSTLASERRKELWTRTEEERRNVYPSRRELREAREQTLQALVAEPFDPKRYSDAQARQLQADQKAREAVYRLYNVIAVNLTPDERRAFLRWREQRRPLQNLLDAPEHQADQKRR